MHFIIVTPLMACLVLSVMCRIRPSPWAAPPPMRPGSPAHVSLLYCPRWLSLGILPVPATPMPSLVCSCLFSKLPWTVPFADWATFLC